MSYHMPVFEVVFLISFTILGFVALVAIARTIKQMWRRK